MRRKKVSAKNRDQLDFKAKGVDKKKPRRPSYPKELTKAKTAFQLWIRVSKSDNNGMCRCICTGQYIHYKSCDGGHYFPATRLGSCFDENNVWPQSKGANMRMNDPFIQEQYKTNLIKIIGQAKFDKLEIQAAQQVKYNVLQLIEIRKHYAELAKELIKQKKI